MRNSRTHTAAVVQPQTAADFIAYTATIIPVSAALHAALNKAAELVTVKKGEVLVTPGCRCPGIYYIQHGLLRGYYLNDGKEITNWLATEGELATSLQAFITGANAQEGIEALEDCALTVLSRSALQELYATFPEMERMGRVLTENYYIRLENRVISLQFASAQHRFDQLMARNSSLFYRAPLGYIASYLGMTQETLSRIRARKNR
jgi:CRP-like cAMP-binding protein